MSYRNNKKYCYNGVEYTMAELEHISHLHHETIQNRLNKGMSIEEALSLPPGQRLPYLQQEDVGKQVPIMFTQPVPSVYENMQPLLKKEYMATIHGKPCNSKALCKVFYTITLENGKTLITYPGEFHLQKTTRID